MERPYTSAQVRHLKSLAQPREARLSVGKDGLSEAFLSQLTASLAREELVKVRLGASPDRAAKDMLAQELAEKTGSFLVTRVGHVAVLYRRATINPKIILP